MRINKNNYEAFFLDFVEGRLDNSSTLEMLAFLRQNPELKADLEAYSNLKLSDSNEIFEDKNILKKLNFNDSEISVKNFDDFCIAYHEKILTSSEVEKLLSYLEKHPGKKDDFRKFGKIYLKADEKIIFDAKSSLQRTFRPLVSRKIVLRWTAVAAGIVIAVAVFYKSPVKDAHPDGSSPKGSIIANVDSVNNIKNEDSIVVNKNVKSTQPSMVGNNSAEHINVATEGTETPKNEYEYIEPIEIAAIETANVSEKVEIKLPQDSISSVPVIKEESRLAEYAGNTVKNIFKKKGTRKGDKKISLWDVAEVTLKGYNQISEKDILLSRETDENGKLTAIAVETENRKYGFNTRN